MQKILKIIALIFRAIANKIKLIFLRVMSVKTTDITYNVVYNMYAIEYDLHNDTSSEIYFYDAAKIVSIKNNALYVKCIGSDSTIKLYVNSNNKAAIVFASHLYEFIFVKSKNSV